MKTIVNTILMVLVFSACSSNEKSSNKASDNKDTLVAENHHDHDSKIELDNGNQWKVDDEMMVFLRNIEQDIKLTKNAAQKDFKKLALSLKSNLDSLTSNCTMSGKAHDELHKWLLPFIDLVNDFDQNNNENVFLKIDSSFVEFNHFFK